MASQRKDVHEQKPDLPVAVNLTTLKVLLIGESGVGKSSLLLRFVDDQFDAEKPATIGVDFKTTTLETAEGRVKLAIWDTAGQERFRTLTPSYYRGGQGVIFVYDVTDSDSFSKLDNWLREFDVYSNKQNAVKMLVANKIDQVRDRVITREDGIKFARKNQMLFIECSAKTKQGVKDAFEELVEKIVSTPGLWEMSPAAMNVRLDSPSEESAPGCCYFF